MSVGRAVTPPELGGPCAACLERAQEAHRGTQHVALDPRGRRCVPRLRVSERGYLVVAVRPLDPRCVALIQIAGGAHYSDCPHATSGGTDGRA